MATNITLKGTTVRKNGSDVPLNFILYLGSGLTGYNNIANGTTQISFGWNVGNMSENSRWKFSDLAGFRKAFDLKWNSDNDVQSKWKLMPFGKSVDNSVKLVLGDLNPFMDLINSINLYDSCFNIVAH